MVSGSETLRLDDLEVPRVIYSPLAGCSDYPFRQMVRQYSKSLIYCEMVKLEPLLRGDPNTFSLLDYSEEMHPIGAQLCGAKVDLVGPCAKIVEDLGFDVVDLNCGCPVDKVTKDGSGSGLLRNPEKIGELISNMVAAVKIPVTVKIRAGWDQDSIIAEQLVEIAEQAGAAMIAIHGRTRKQGYSGTADRDVIKAAKCKAKSIKVAGNGDVFDAESAKHMFNHTGCDAVLISRGTMGQPWLADSIYGATNIHDPLQVLLGHFDRIAAYRNDKRASLDMRRVGPWYCRDDHNIRDLRAKLSKVKATEDAYTLVQNHLSIR